MDEEHTSENLNAKLKELEEDIEEIQGILEKPEDDDVQILELERGERQVIVHWIELPQGTLVTDLAEAETFFQSCDLVASPYATGGSGRAIGHGDLMVMNTGECLYIAYVVNVDRVAPDYSGIQAEAPTDDHALSIPASAAPGEPKKELIIWSTCAGEGGGDDCSHDHATAVDVPEVSEGSVEEIDTSATSTESVASSAPVTDAVSASANLTIPVDTVVTDVGWTPLDVYLASATTTIPEVTGAVLVEGDTAANQRVYDVDESVLTPVYVEEIGPSGIPTSFTGTPTATVGTEDFPITGPTGGFPVTFDGTPTATVQAASGVGITGTVTVAGVGSPTVAIDVDVPITSGDGPYALSTQGGLVTGTITDQPVTVSGSATVSGVETLASDVDVSGGNVTIDSFAISGTPSITGVKTDSGVNIDVASGASVSLAPVTATGSVAITGVKTAPGINIDVASGASVSLAPVTATGPTTITGVKTVAGTVDVASGASVSLDTVTASGSVAITGVKTASGVDVDVASGASVSLAPVAATGSFSSANATEVFKVPVQVCVEGATVPLDILTTTSTLLLTGGSSAGYFIPSGGIPFSGTLTPSSTADVSGTVAIKADEAVTVADGTASGTLTAGSVGVTGAVAIKPDEAVTVTGGTATATLTPSTTADVSGFVALKADEAVAVTGGTASGTLTSGSVGVTGAVAIKPDEAVAVTGGTISGSAQSTGTVGLSGKVDIAGGQSVNVTGGSVTGQDVKVNSTSVDVNIAAQTNAVLAHLEAGATVNVNKSDIPISVPDFNAQIKPNETVSVAGGATVGLTLDQSSATVNLPTAEVDRQITVTGGTIPVTLDPIAGCTFKMLVTEKDCDDGNGNVYSGNDPDGWFFKPMDDGNELTDNTPQIKIWADEIKLTGTGDDDADGDPTVESITIPSLSLSSSPTTIATDLFKTKAEVSASATVSIASGDVVTGLTPVSIYQYETASTPVAILGSSSTQAAGVKEPCEPSGGSP